RLAAAGLSDNADELSLGDGEVDAVDRPHRAVAGCVLDLQVAHAQLLVAVADRHVKQDLSRSGGHDASFCRLRPIANRLWSIRFMFELTKGGWRFVGVDNVNE